jgi:hypothetical protein
MAWYTVRLELARTRDFPNGSGAHGYLLRAPLDQDGGLDEAQWRDHKTAANVKRFWENEDDEHGKLVHTRHRTWAFSYGPGEEDDEPFYHLETHKLKVGEYVSIKEHDGETLPFRVADVRSEPLPL